MSGKQVWKRAPGWFFIGTLCLGCQSKDGAPPNPPTPPPAVHRVATTEIEKQNGNLRARLQSLPAPNSYQVALDWSAAHADSDLWLVEREDEKSGLKHLATFEATRTEFVDSTVAAGETYRYWLAVPEGANAAIRESVVIRIPVDLQVTGSQAFREIRGVRRLFLSPGSRLGSLGNRLQIDVEEIVAQGGVIETFAQGRAAAPGAQGRSARKISLRAKRGSGIVEIVARGENGGTGMPGTPGVSGTQGPAGSGAHIGLKPTAGYYPEEFIQRAYLADVPADHPRWRDFYQCNQMPGNGGRGGSGLPGGAGMAGGRGGDTAPVFVEITNPSALQVKVIRLVGGGGAGGPGGRGGWGGPGGDPGADPHRICAAANAGLVGGVGLPGAPGNGGAAGAEQPYCLKMGNAVFGQCEAFPLGDVD